jgi:hypothetical protein
VNQFGAGRGTFYQSVATNAEAKFAMPEIGVYVEDAFSANRYDAGDCSASVSDDELIAITHRATPRDYIDMAAKYLRHFFIGGSDSRAGIFRGIEELADRFHQVADHPIRIEWGFIRRQLRFPAGAPRFPTAVDFLTSLPYAATVVPTPSSPLFPEIARRLDSTAILAFLSRHPPRPVDRKPASHRGGRQVVGRIGAGRQGP